MMKSEAIFLFNPHYPYQFHSIFPAVHSEMERQANDRKSEFNTPFLPLLGEHSFDELMKHIHQSIVDEATAADFYVRLLKETPDALHRDFVQHAHDDELEHLEAFTKLYTHFTGKKPQYKIKPVKFSNYKAGILKALKDELEAVEFYRNVQLSCTDPLVRDTFYFAMVDELEHSTKFGVLYNSL
jgi:rubrerythrin